MNMTIDTNKITLSDFNSSLAIIMSKIAAYWTPAQLLTFNYEFFRIKIIDIAKKNSLIEEEYLPIFMKFILDLSDNKVNSLKNALLEYSSVLHTL